MTVGDVFIFILVLAAAATLTAIFAWGIKDADRQAKARLIADTRAPQVLDIGAGWYSATAEDEFAAYYPSALRAHPGDTIRFTNPTIEDPHSVTFGLRYDRRNQHHFGTGNPLPNINGPCVSATALTSTTDTCDGIDASGSLPAFNGQAYFNSGIIPPGGGVFELRLAEDLPTGTYEFVCVIHPQQVGTVEVVPRGEPTQRPRDLDATAKKQFEDDMDELRGLRTKTRNRRLGDDADVQAGSATSRASLNVFLPAETTIKAGETVTWTNSGPVPHVIIFGGYLSPPQSVETPPTLPSGSAVSAGLFTTGPIGAPPYPRTSFKLRFDTPGSYPYVCTLHPGMGGVVTVG